MRNILIVSGEGDAHTEYMGRILTEKRISYFLFPTNKYPFNAKITYTSEGCTLSYNGKFISLNNEWTIWNRRIFDPEFPKDFPKTLEDLVKEETRRTLQGIMITHLGLIVNNPLNNHCANNKSEQLKRAKNLGFRIPDTLITNEPNIARKFYEKHNGNIIFKMQNLPIIKDEDGIHKTVMTNRVLPNDLNNFNRISNNPSYFQELIEKKYEIRLTIIGNRLFPIAIYSQNSELSKDDFRRYNFDNVKYELVNIPKDIADKSLELVKQYRLSYSAIDLILTPKGEYVFLENNPNGQYLWTEEMSKTQITNVFADYLAGNIND